VVTLNAGVGGNLPAFSVSAASSAVPITFDRLVGNTVAVAIAPWENDPTRQFMAFGGPDYGAVVMRGWKVQGQT